MHILGTELGGFGQMTLLFISLLAFGVIRHWLCGPSDDDLREEADLNRRRDYWASSEGQAELASWPAPVSNEEFRRQLDELAARHQHPEESTPGPVWRHYP